MLQSIILNYPKGRLTIFEQSIRSSTIAQCGPEYAESVKAVNDLFWSFALLKKDYHLDIKITPKRPGMEQDELLFQIMNGFYNCNPKLMSIARHIAEKRIFPEACAIEHLSPMQKKIVKHVRRGLTYTQIAKKLSLSPHTVNGHRKKAMKIIGVTSIKDLISYLDRFSID